MMDEARSSPALSSTALAYLDRGIIASVALFALMAPHSIAATQGAFLLGVVLWMVRIVIRRSLDYQPMGLDLPILIFVWWSLLAAIFSYEPALSFVKVRSVGLFLIVFLVAQNLPNREWGKRWVLILVLSSFVSVGYVFWQKSVGRGLQLVESTKSVCTRLVASSVVIQVSPRNAIAMSAKRTFPACPQLTSKKRI